MQERSYTYLAFGPLLVVMVVGAGGTVLAGLMIAEPETFGLVSRTGPIVATAVVAAVTAGLCWLMNRRMQAGAVQVRLDATGITVPRNAMSSTPVRWDYARIADIRSFSFRTSKILELVHQDGRKIGIPRTALTSDADFNDLTMNVLMRHKAVTESVSTDA